MVSCFFQSQLESVWTGLESTTRFWSEFWQIFVIFGQFWPIFGKVRTGEPHISVEEGRLEILMVREWSHVVSKVNWSRFGPGWSRVDTVLGRGLAVFCHFWPFLAIFGHFWPGRKGPK